MVQNRKNVVKPKVWNSREVYMHYADELLAANPEWWGRYSKKRKLKNFWIYRNDLKAGKVVEVMNYDRWMDVLAGYFMSARTHITHGEPLNLGNDLGRIEGKRVERNFANKKINFRATAERPKVMGENGKLRPDIIIFYTDDDWVRISWVKSKHLTNETAYKFVPCAGDKNKDGFKEQFSNANMQNPSLKFKYRFHPYVQRHNLHAGK